MEKGIDAYGVRLSRKNKKYITNYLGKLNHKTITCLYLGVILS